MQEPLGFDNDGNEIKFEDILSYEDSVLKEVEANILSERIIAAIDKNCTVKRNSTGHAIWPLWQETAHAERNCQNARHLPFICIQNRKEGDPEDCPRFQMMAALSDGSQPSRQCSERFRQHQDPPFLHENNYHDPGILQWCHSNKPMVEHLTPFTPSPALRRPRLPPP